MIDRSKYTEEYAPPAQDLIDDWTKNLPTGAQVESFFLDELCESSECTYFLCVSDLFLDVIRRQEKQDRLHSLQVIHGRLLDAAEFARQVDDKELVHHFEKSIAGFSDLFDEQLQTLSDSKSRESLHVGSLVLRAIRIKELPMARLISNAEIELRCTNSACENDAELRCPDCKETVVPYEFYRWHHNLRNCPDHPAT